MVAAGLVGTISFESANVKSNRKHNKLVGGLGVVAVIGLVVFVVVVVVETLGREEKGAKHCPVGPVLRKRTDLRCSNCPLSKMLKTHWFFHGFGSAPNGGGVGDGGGGGAAPLGDRVSYPFSCRVSSRIRGRGFRDSLAATN